MQRYFVAPEQMQEEFCFIEGADVHHLLHVLRSGEGEQLLCSNGQGRTVLAQIERIEKERIYCQIIKEIVEERELPIRVTIAQGLPKGDKMEWVLQKGTELGAHFFIPFLSQRTIVKYDQKKEQKRLERWQKISKEAAEQAHRQILPVIKPIHTWKELLQVQADCKLVAYEHAQLERGQGPAPFVQALNALTGGEHLLVVIGPEGGLEEYEVQELLAHGFQSISLGRRILRTETAASYVLAALSFYFEQIGE